MDDRATTYSGGCLCGALRYEARGAPMFAGHCYCRDCRKASGSAFVPFIGFLATAVTLSGEARQFRSPSFRGGVSVRNNCPTCGILVFGGEAGKDDVHTLYAGTLDDPSLFHPSIAIFAKECPAWSPVPPTLTMFPTMPDREAADQVGEEVMSEEPAAKVVKPDVSGWRSFLSGDADGRLGRMLRSAAWLSRHHYGEGSDTRR